MQPINSPRARDASETADAFEYLPFVRVGAIIHLSRILNGADELEIVAAEARVLWYRRGSWLHTTWDSQRDRLEVRRHAVKQRAPEIFAPVVSIEFV